MTPGSDFAWLFAGMLIFLGVCIALSVWLARWMDKRDKVRHGHYGKEVEESETPVKDRWGIGGK